MVNHQPTLASRATDAILWRIFQNFSSTLVSFILQIWLARLLLPEDYGVIALTSVFITLSMVFVEIGFTSALIQRPELTDMEINSAFYSGIFIASVLYILIYTFSPAISKYYQEPILKSVLRTQGLLVIIASIYSVPVSLIQRELQFKKTFIANGISSIAQGALGIVLAMKGFGVWALVYGSILQAVLYCVLVLGLSKWKPKLKFSLQETWVIFAYSSKILLMRLLNTLFENAKSLIIGKLFSPTLLGFYNRGYQIPILAMTNIDGAINAVSFPVFSKLQHDYVDLGRKIRKSLQVSIYIVWPAMIGLVVVSESLVTVLLTKKWLASVPFLQLTALICMTWPFSVFLHAINGIGKSEISLILTVVTIAVEILAMAISYRFGIYYFVGSSLVSGVVTTIVVVLVASRIIGFSVRALLIDILPTLVVSIIMGICVYSIKLIGLNVIATLGMQVAVGLIVYFLLTWLLKFPSLVFIVTYIKDLISRKNIKLDV